MESKLIYIENTFVCLSDLLVSYGEKFDLI